MIRQNKVPLAVLAALLIAWLVVPSQWGAPDPMALEQDSERIGWGGAAIAVRGSRVAG